VKRVKAAMEEALHELNTEQRESSTVCFCLHSSQGDHLSGKPGNVGEFETCQGNVRDVVNSQGNVREKILSWKSVPQLFITR